MLTKPVTTRCWSMIFAGMILLLACAKKPGSNGEDVGSDSDATADGTGGDTGRETGESGRDGASPTDEPDLPIPDEEGTGGTSTGGAEDPAEDEVRGEPEPLPVFANSLPVVRETIRTESGNPAGAVRAVYSLRGGEYLTFEYRDGRPRRGYMRPGLIHRRAGNAAAVGEILGDEGWSHEYGLCGSHLEPVISPSRKVLALDGWMIDLATVAEFYRGPVHNSWWSERCHEEYKRFSGHFAGNYYAYAVAEIEDNSRSPISNVGARVDLRTGEVEPIHFARNNWQGYEYLDPSFPDRAFTFGQGNRNVLSGGYYRDDSHGISILSEGALTVSPDGQYHYHDTRRSLSGEDPPDKVLKDRQGNVLATPFGSPKARSRRNLWSANSRCVVDLDLESGEVQILAVPSGQTIQTFNGSDHVGIPQPFFSFNGKRILMWVKRNTDNVLIYHLHPYCHDDSP